MTIPALSIEFSFAQADSQEWDGTARRKFIEDFYLMMSEKAPTLNKITADVAKTGKLHQMLMDRFGTESASLVLFRTSFSPTPSSPNLVVRVQPIVPEELVKWSKEEARAESEMLGNHWFAKAATRLLKRLIPSDVLAEADAAVDKEQEEEFVTKNQAVWISAALSVVTNQVSHWKAPNGHVLVSATICADDRRVPVDLNKSTNTPEPPASRITIAV